MPDSTETRTYEVTTKAGDFRITVPADTRVTFGPVVSVAGKPSYGEGGHSLRFWKGKDTQLALFLNVVAFRDTSLPMQVRAVRKYGTEDWMVDDGSWIGPKTEQVERGWIDFDDIREPADDPDTAAHYGVVDIGPSMLMKPRRNRSFVVTSEDL
jgi:hypothetical protein